MMPCRRGPEPEALAREGAQIGRDYAARRRETPSFRFQWRKAMFEVVREALAAMTAGHCSYCDGHPLGATGVETVDHFRPKSRPEFHELVCSWTNLFLTCTACNHAKREQWDEALLRPDDPGFHFERYFECRFDSGKLEPASAASAEEQHRAVRTIEILDLNRADTCAARKRVVREVRSSEAIDDFDDWAYRYLIPICRPV
jgi:uncharacterized protein (TIGR02646 family)